MTGTPRFAVIVPAYNEADNIPTLFAALRSTFDKHSLEGEVIIVDDGSTDRTYELAVAEAAKFGRNAHVVRHRRNLGKTEGMVTGSRAATAPVLIVFDADLQHSTEEIPRFMAKIDQGWDIVTGRKVGAYEKQAVSSVYNRMSRKLFDVPVRDLNSMKAFKAEILQGLALRHDWHRFFVVLAYAQGYSVTEIDIELFPRNAGVSKYTGSKRIFSSVGDLLVVWFYLRFSRKPMQLFGGAGVVLTVLGLAIGLVLVVLRAMEWGPPSIGYRPLLGLVVLLIVVGITLFGFGFTAEMIALLRSDVEQLKQGDHRRD
ncbi:MAG TPA: glycosyltransferase family 2 protein [Gemmatimonadaceae bacterium]|nr:glycosyltransferase family 2 protein [Gemmatimonadaceae bacterium]